MIKRMCGQISSLSHAYVRMYVRTCVRTLGHAFATESGCEPLGGCSRVHRYVHKYLHNVFWESSDLFDVLKTFSAGIDAHVSGVLGVRRYVHTYIPFGSALVGPCDRAFRVCTYLGFWASLDTLVCPQPCAQLSGLSNKPTHSR